MTQLYGTVEAAVETKVEDIVGAPLTQTLPPGTQVGSYRIEGVLGEGAMGLVYRAVHESLARKVAIKVLKPQAAADRGLVERFIAEAVAVNIIGHENIVECTDTVTEHGNTFVVMEMLDGSSLREALRAAKRMPPGRAIRIAIQIARAIGAAHAKEIIHRDLKPENVFLIRRGENNDYVKVLDFGIARLRPEMGYVTATQTGALMGTPAYMSPEQASGERAVPVSDVYALGIILFELISGRLPFTAKNVGLMFAAQIGEVPKRLDVVAPGTPKRLADLVAEMLEKDPQKRPLSMAVVEQRLETLQDEADGAVMKTNPEAFTETLLPGQVRKRSMWPIVIAAGAVVVIGAGMVVSAVLGMDKGPGRTSGGAPPDAGAAIDTPADAAVDAPVDAQTRRERLADSKQPFQMDRQKYIDNTKALFKKRTHDLEFCWGIHRKLHHRPNMPKTLELTVRFELDDQGEMKNVWTSVPPEPEVAGRNFREDLGSCLLERTKQIFFAPPYFDVPEPMKFEFPVTLK